MTDVIQGGATVFPQAATTLWPKKGTAAFWYNLYDNGEGDYKTKHAACPVLAGTKWGDYLFKLTKFFRYLSDYQSCHLIAKDYQHAKLA